MYTGYKYGYILRITCKSIFTSSSNSLVYLSSRYLHSKITRYTITRVSSTNSASGGCTGDNSSTTKLSFSEKLGAKSSSLNTSKLRYQCDFLTPNPYEDNR